MQNVGILLGQSAAENALFVKLTSQTQGAPNGGHLKIELDPLLLLAMLDETLKTQGSLLSTALGGLSGVEVEFSLVLSASSLTQLASREPARSLIFKRETRLVQFQVERSLIVADWESNSGPGRSVFVVTVDERSRCLEIEIERTSIGLERSTWPDWVATAFPNASSDGRRLKIDLHQFKAVTLDWPPLGGRLTLRGSIGCLIPFLRYFF